MKKIILLFVLTMLASGCASPRYSYNSATGINKATTIYIVESPEVKASFLNLMQDWLYKHKYGVKVLSPNSETTQYEWSLTYHALQSWDLDTFLRDATIRAFKYGVFAGDSKFYAPNNFNLGKYTKAEVRVNKMMDNLFSEKNNKNVIKDVK